MERKRLPPVLWLLLGMFLGQLDTEPLLAVASTGSQRVVAALAIGMIAVTAIMLAVYEEDDPPKRRR